MRLQLSGLATLGLFFCSAAYAQYPKPSTPTSALPTFLVDPATGNPVAGGGGGSSGSTTTKPGSYTLVPLDVASVTTGGTAVTALSAGHRTAGGWLQNPQAATINLCINEIGTASGTTSAGSTTCIAPGQTYTLTPSSGAVSVVSSDSAHAFSGMGLQ